VFELDGGGEEPAALADGLEVAVQFCRSGAPAVGQHPSVLSSDVAHGRALGFGAERAGLVVEGFDLGRDCLVFGGHGAVGDAGVAGGHLQGLVSQQGGHRFEAHPAVDGLGAQGVAQPVRMDVSHPGLFGHPVEHAGNGVAVQHRALIGEQQPRRAIAVARLPLLEQADQDRVKRNVAVVVQLADRHSQPPPVTDADHGVGFQGAHFADPHAGAHQQLEHQPGAGVGLSRDGPGQTGGVGVVEKLG
jgi:hypothetical protein